MYLHDVNRSKDFIFEQSLIQPFKKRELIVRVFAILLISFLSPTVDFSITVSNDEFLKILLLSIVRTTLLWHGSMIIINFSTYRYSIFREPFKLLGIQLSALALFVFLVEKGEILAFSWIMGYDLQSGRGNELIYTALLITFLISTIYAAIGFFMQWKQNLVRAQELEKANLEARYETLKAQVNPHFLFNSLNTLLSIVQGNAEAEMYIGNLSEFMRYILSNRDKQKVLLREELEVLAQYVYLQKIRFGNKLQVEIYIPSEFHTCFIPPLTLQMLVENAIKHNEVSSENALQIRLFVHEGTALVVANTLRRKLDADPSTGVGLKNIESRYQILVGKGIEIAKKEGWYNVSLPLISDEQ